MSEKNHIVSFLNSANQNRLCSFTHSHFLWSKQYSKDADLYLLDTDTQDAMIKKILSEHAQKVILISHQDFETVLFDYLCRYPINHVIGQESLVFERELAMHLDYKIKKNNLSLETVLRSGSEIISARLRDSKATDLVMEDMFKKINIGPFFDSPLEYLKVLGNELLMNAFYSAEHNDTPRTKQIILDKEVELKFGVDEDFLAISVKDPFGALNRNQLIKSLERGFREKKPIDKKGGAGLGLYMTLSSTNQIIIKVDKQISTEIICVIDRSKRMKTFKSRTTSFNFYEGV